ncbi:hypothetical protein [Thermomonospora cellulosilytica]|uniref:Nucleotide-binding universal stress UspA family protein n=1 Tax=Thermomonospora cellulosilytica TaxID=1411118 RepID=A0A7W3MU41_9ACTN|nr:hypothetical protein [Thermomonospora cellulosilytica]MBA9001943.1 nucleotide-binding universal stress UspA family protein [Thermomonospora cellulosilytica]
MTTDEERRQALQALAAVLRGQGYRVTVACHHLTAGDGAGRVVEVWAQRRASDNGRLWFTEAGGFPICEADKPADALVAVKGALRQVGP